MNQLIVEKTEAAVRALIRCLEHYFQEASAREKQIEIKVEGGAPGAYRQGQGVAAPLVFYLPGGGRKLEGQLRVDGTGGNVYAVEVELEGGDPEGQSVTLPELDLPAGALLKYCRPFCERMLTLLEQRAGEESLQKATGRQTGQP